MAEWLPEGDRPDYHEPVARHIALNITLGDPTTGIWCMRCMTSSGFKVGLYVMGENGPCMIGTAEQCSRCDYPE